MSRYQHLPLHDAFYRYTKELYVLKKRLPKDLRHDLGQFKVLGDRLTEISKQVSAWRKWSKDELKKSIK